MFLSDWGSVMNDYLHVEFTLSLDSYPLFVAENRGFHSFWFVLTED